MKLRLVTLFCMLVICTPVFGQDVEINRDELSFALTEQLTDYIQVTRDELARISKGFDELCMYDDIGDAVFIICVQRRFLSDGYFFFAGSDTEETYLVALLKDGEVYRFVSSDINKGRLAMVVNDLPAGDYEFAIIVFHGLFDSKQSYKFSIGSN